MAKDVSFQRAVAIKTTISNLYSGTYFKGSEDSPSYLLTINDKKIFRINLMGIILEISKIGSITNVVLDDGTGNIVMRVFEENSNIEKLNVGDAILCIGRLRIYNEERYISHEIVKKINPIWLKVRSLELKEEYKEDKKSDNKDNLIDSQTGQKNKEMVAKKNEINKDNDNKLESKNVEVDEIELVNQINENIPSQKLINLIKELDNGKGVLIEELIEKSNLKMTEKIIERMLESGEIFQNLPGKVKVL